MNKLGKTSPVIWVVLLLVAGVFGYMIYNGGTTQSVVNTNTGADDVGSCPDSSSVITVNGYSTLAPSTAISSPTITIGKNGGKVVTSVTSGTTAVPVGTRLVGLVSKGSYIDDTFETTAKCGGTQIDIGLYASSSTNPSIRIKNDDGDFMTDGFTGATNQTTLSAGETVKWDVEYSGVARESTGTITHVFEFPAGSSANITSVSMSNAKKVPTPKAYTSQNAGSFVQAFEVPAVVDGEKVVHTLSIELQATKTLEGGVYTDWYDQQKFIDTDGTIKEGVEDSDGTAKYENTGDFDVFINA